LGISFQEGKFPTGKPGGSPRLQDGYWILTSYHYKTVSILRTSGPLIGDFGDDIHNKPGTILVPLNFMGPARLAILQRFLYTEFTPDRDHSDRIDEILDICAV
jgi:hypothetical protein